MKTYYFLAGLPRSGNTLLSSLLNQNPQIYSSPLSPIPSFLWNYEQSLTQIEAINQTNNKNQINNVGKKIINNYYEHINKSIVIDRQKAWGTQGNIDLIKKYITPTPKIIFTVRPVIEILTSFINILPEHSYIDIEMEQLGWWSKKYLTRDDNRCDYLMRSFGQIDKSLFAINEIIKPENKKMFCLIKYDEMVNDPNNVMNKIYKYLQLPNYNHNFNNIKKIENDDYGQYEQVINLHEIRPQLKKISKDPREVLSEYVINKYSNIGWEGL